MIKFFRRIRQQLLTENRMGKYFFYAVGEIVLVVIGILIALQINNTNEDNKQRAKELHYLENIKTDLLINIAELDKFIAVRNTRITSADNVLEFFEGKPLVDLVQFNIENINVHTWKRFYQNNNTFQELTNSGNLAIISNDSIKNMLLDIELLYKIMKSEEDHLRYDFETLMYTPFFRDADSNPMIKNFTYQVTDGQAGENLELPRADFEKLLSDVQHKNGFVMASYMFSVIKEELVEIKSKSQQLIDIIDSELSDNE